MLLEQLELQLTSAVAAREEWSRYYEAARTADGATVERALLAAGMSQIEADRLCNTGACNPLNACLRRYSSARNAATKLERRIAGLRRWRERRAS